MYISKSAFRLQGHLRHVQHRHATPEVILAGPQCLLPSLWLSSSASGLQPHSRASPASAPPFVLIPLTSNSSGGRYFPTLSALSASWSSISSRQDISRGRRSRVLLHLFRPLPLVWHTPPLHKPFPARILSSPTQPSMQTRNLIHALETFPQAPKGIRFEFA